MAKKVRIVLAEGHTILREGLRALLSSNSNLEIVGDAEDGLKAVDCVKKLEPDLLLMDLSIPRMSGIETIKNIKNRYPETKIIALTTRNEDYLLATLHAGADGYVLEDATHNELVMAIKNVMAGESCFSHSVFAKVTKGYREGKKSSKSVSTWETISKREREVLKLIAEGYKNKEIAEDLDISIKTVEKHREGLMKKLDLHNVAALTVFAMGKGLIKPEI